MKQLEEILNLAPDVKPEPAPDIEEVKEAVNNYTTVMDNADKIDAALPVVDNSTSTDELEELSNTAKEAFNDLFTLAMNADTQYTARIGEIASSFLGHAITAKTTKIKTKLQIVEQQLKKARLDLLASKGSGEEEPVDGDGEIIDRNALLAELLKKKDA